MDIEIEFDEREVNRMKNSRSEPMLGFKISANDTYLVGSADGYSKTYAVDYLLGLNNLAKSSLEGEKHICIDHNGPTYLVAEQCTNGSVQLSLCVSLESAKNPSQRSSYETEVCVELAELVSEVITASKRLRNRITAYDSELSTHPEIEHLNDAISESEEVFEDL